MEDKELYDEIIWVMQNYGSDAAERQTPGSKLRQQAGRIVEFVTQRERAWELLHTHNINLVKITRADK